MTDYDGTLAPIKDRPELALPVPGVLKALERMAGNPKFKVAVISGRDLEDLKSRLPVEGICLVGSHGAEIMDWASGTSISLFDDQKTPSILETIATEVLASISGEQGFWLERKKVSVALHYRLADPFKAVKLLENCKKSIEHYVAESGLEFLSGKKILEIKPRAVNKGTAVNHLMNGHPGYYPLYIGDDTTDEDAFRAIKDRGTGILVSYKRQLHTAAHYRLENPGDVLAFLQIISS